MTLPTHPEQKLPFHALVGDETSWNEQQQARWERVQSYAMRTAIAGCIGYEPSNEVELSMEGLGAVKQIAQTVIDWHRTKPLPGEDFASYIAYLAEREARNTAPAGSDGTAA